MIGRAGVNWRRFRALDKATGQLISEVDLPVGATGGPMTFLAGGKQYIAVPVGGAGYGGGGSASVSRMERNSLCTTGSWREVVGGPGVTCLAWTAVVVIAADLGGIFSKDQVGTWRQGLPGEVRVVPWQST